jgi:hypothetical protein
MSNDRNIKQDREYWYAKGKWHGGMRVFWIMLILNFLTIILTYGGNK